MKYTIKKNYFLYKKMDIINPISVPLVFTLFSLSQSSDMISVHKAQETAK